MYSTEIGGRLLLGMDQRLMGSCHDHHVVLLITTNHVFALLGMDAFTLVPHPRQRVAGPLTTAPRELGGPSEEMFGRIAEDLGFAAHSIK